MSVMNPVVVESAAPHSRPRTSATRAISPALYAAGTVVPLVSLGQRTTWYADARAPHGTLVDWWLTGATPAGWVLSTVFVLSFAGLSRPT